MQSNVVEKVPFLWLARRVLEVTQASYAIWIVMFTCILIQQQTSRGKVK